MQNFAYSSGEGIQMVYTSLIDYMAGFLDWSGTPVSGWKFDKEQNMQFQFLGCEKTGWLKLDNVCRQTETYESKWSYC